MQVGDDLGGIDELGSVRSVSVLLFGRQLIELSDDAFSVPVHDVLGGLDCCHTGAHSEVGGNGVECGVTVSHRFHFGLVCPCAA